MLQEKRLQGVYRELDKLGVSQMVITNPYAIYYLTGKFIAPMERLLAMYIHKDKPPKLYLNILFHCPEELGIEKVWMDDNDNGAEIISRDVDTTQPLGVDKDLPARHLLPLMEYCPGIRFVNSSLAVDRQRGIKDEAEQADMILSSEINDAAIALLKERVRPGATEAELADAINEIFVSLGAESGEGLVAFGVNAADPHHWSDNTVLQEGDAVLFDIGGSKNSYLSDMTRTFFYRRADDEARKIYDLVKRANEAAEAAIRPGVPLCELDRIARDIIADAGYGEYFTHRLGHFIGLEIHEYGDVSAKNTDLAQEGMCFSIEPGIYLPGRTGVRIEDIVLVTADGCRVLNRYSKELEIIE